MSLCALVIDPLLDGDLAMGDLVEEHGELPPAPSSYDDVGRERILFLRPRRFSPVTFAEGLELVPTDDCDASAPVMPPWLRTRAEAEVVEREVKSGLVGRAFAEAGMTVRYLGSCGIVRCPFGPDHHGAVFTPRRGSALGWFECRRCRPSGRRTMSEVLGALPVAAVARARKGLDMPAAEVAAPAALASKEEALRSLFDELTLATQDNRGLSVGGIAAAAFASGADGVALQLALAELMDLPLGRAPDSQSLGRMLVSHENRIIDGRALERRGALWRVIDVKTWQKNRRAKATKKRTEKKA